MEGLGEVSDAANRRVCKSVPVSPGNALVPAGGPNARANSTATRMDRPQTVLERKKDKSPGRRASASRERAKEALRAALPNPKNPGCCVEGTSAMMAQMKGADSGMGFKVRAASREQTQWDNERKSCVRRTDQCRLPSSMHPGAALSVEKERCSRASGLARVSNGVRSGLPSGQCCNREAEGTCGGFSSLLQPNPPKDENLGSCTAAM